MDVDSLELTRPRTVGVEQLALWAMQQLNFLDLLAHLGINGAHIAAIVGSIIGRMAGVGSELATHNWLMKQSALGELLDVDYASLPLMTMYRAADTLWKHSARIEQTLFTRITDLFGFSTTITLYDLTNTYFEGEVPHNTKARHGRSKEKRTDCPLVTLGLVLDGSGFVRRSSYTAPLPLRFLYSFHEWLKNSFARLMGCGVELTNQQERKSSADFFQIMFKDLNCEFEKELWDYQTTLDDHIARVDGGRLIELLPLSIDALVQKNSGNNYEMLRFLNDYTVAFEADIINLLIGPLTEAKHIHETDGEVFNHQLVNLHTLKNYGGSSDLALVNEYRVQARK